MNQSYHILIVEDDLDDQFLLSTCLQQAYPQPILTFVENGLEALSIIETGDYKPHVILLDINMPIVNGFEVLAQLRQTPAYKAIPVLVLTTSSNPRDVTKASELGASGFVTKPTHFQEYLNLASLVSKNWLN
jgi:CheY-like chemotaxis protein